MRTHKEIKKEIEEMNIKLHSLLYGELKKTPCFLTDIEDEEEIRINCALCENYQFVLKKNFINFVTEHKITFGVDIDELEFNYTDKFSYSIVGEFETCRDKLNN